MAQAHVRRLLTKGAVSRHSHLRADLFLLSAGSLLTPRAFSSFVGIFDEGTHGPEGLSVDEPGA